MSDGPKTPGSPGHEDRVAVDFLVDEAAGGPGEEETGWGEQAGCASGGLVLRSKVRPPMEIVCGVCGVRSIGADADDSCRAYALHMYTAHGRTVSYSDGRALARPLDRRILAA